MAKKPDTLCAGGCGRLLWSGRGALPAGERTCRECRGRGLAPKPARVRGPGAERLCGAGDCDRQHYAKGVCRKHHSQNRRAAGLGASKIRSIVLFSMASLYGAAMPKVKPVKCKVTVGLMVECPWCGSFMSGTSSASRYCRACWTTVELNPEEVSWVIYETHSTAA